ncbi:MAG TPA: GNAT family N-acetyltransferase [Stellaceae bacterium]|nr:GNAT family N-acetyltransferase [Stellaceae bacterium]
MESSGNCNPVELPRLSADGLLLRAFEYSDLPLVQEAAADPYIPHVTTVPATFNENEGMEFIRRQWSRSANGEGYSFAIVRVPGDRAIGQAWLSLQNATEGRVSIGYWIGRSARGKDVATQALLLISRWAALLPNVCRLELYVEPWNTPSLRVAEKAGYRREGLIEHEHKDMLLYFLLSREITNST